MSQTQKQARLYTRNTTDELQEIHLALIGNGLHDEWSELWKQAWELILKAPVLPWKPPPRKRLLLPKTCAAWKDTAYEQTDVLVFHLQFICCSLLSGLFPICVLHVETTFRQVWWRNEGWVDLARMHWTDDLFLSVFDSHVCVRQQDGPRKIEEHS